jgi:hypothetical protein
MRKILLPLVAAIAILMLPCSAALAQSPSPTAPAVNLTWTAGSPAWTACSTTVTAACSWYYLVIDATVPSAPVTLTPANTLAVTATSYTTPPYTNNAFGTRLYNLVLVYKDVTGATQMDVAATCGTTNTAPPCAVTGIPVVPPPSPTGLKGTAVTQ